MNYEKDRFMCQPTHRHETSNVSCVRHKFQSTTNEILS